MSSVMFYGLFITIIAEEPKHNNQPSSFFAAVYNPFIEFFNRHVSLSVPVLILLFILLYKIGDTMAHSLSTNFYLDIGFTKTEIGTVVKFFGLMATLVGAFAGGLISLRIGLYLSLIHI